MSGKVVASEPKGNRACGAPRNSANGVTVRPLDPSAQMTTQNVDSAYTEPAVGVVAPRPYDYGYGYAYDGYDPYGFYGYSPFYYPSIGFYGRGGYGRGFVGHGSIGRGSIGRGRGRR